MATDDWLPLLAPVRAYIPALRQTQHLLAAELGWAGWRGRTLAVRGVCDGRRYVVPLALVVDRGVRHELTGLMEESQA